MKKLIAAFLFLGLLSSANAQLVFKAKSGPGKGRNIVLIAGDEEYRTEESCPMLAKLLSQRFGFNCTVVFPMSADGKYIDPNNQKSLPGLESLAKADLMIIGTRFRQPSDKDYGYLADFLNAGKPVIGFRTATHAFTGKGQTGDFKWREFGPKILGEGWVNHHGRHKSEGARGIIDKTNAKHPILNGVKDVFGPSDVYGIRRVTPENATILMHGQVTDSLASKSKAVAGKKNDPMMPIAWLRGYTAPNGKSSGQAFCTTFGASVDFKNAGLRRMMVNAVFHLLELKVPTKAGVATVDKFEPTFYGFIRAAGYFKDRNLQPSDFALGKTTSTGLPSPAASKKKPAKKKKLTEQINPKDRHWVDRSKGAERPHAPDAEPPAAKFARSQKIAKPAKGERIVLIGNQLAERDSWLSQMEPELHLRYPQHNLFFRNMGRSGDTPGFRPHPARASQWAFPGAEKFHPDLQQHNGKGFFSTPDQWLHHLKADTVVAFFGYNESFGGKARVANFEAELSAFVKHSLSKAYNGKQAPRLVLVSPIAFENLSDTRDLPNGKTENANLALYTAAMGRVAKKNGLTFINVFNLSKQAYAKSKQPFTINGFAPTKAGYRQIGKWLAEGLYGRAQRQSKANAGLVQRAVQEKDWLWNNDYNLVNGVHTHGQRYNPYGPQNYPDEVRKTREMALVRDGLIHEIVQGRRTDLKVDDSKTHALPPVPTNFKANDKKMGSVSYQDGQRAIKDLKMADGFQVELFASEKQFPDLKNPVQMSFDNQGRLWVAVMPGYPHWKPGDPMPDDKLIILEDTDNDGRADKQTTFARGLQLPIGFEIAPEGVYVSQEPNLVRLVDDNNDDKADRTEVLLHGFDSHDTHHAISAYSADASGAFYMGEGRFLHSQVETPYGPQRCNDGGVWRFDPKSFRLIRYAQTDVSNPWSISFDKWEQCFIGDGSPGNSWYGLPISAKMPYGVEIPKFKTFVPKRARPTSGSEFVSSRHFPDEWQGAYMICNSIGFLGISIAKVETDGAGYKGELISDLIASSDPNFRPVDLEFAPDGSLYLVDWHNALIGHMQHNARDPNRDHDHGRIYRITHKTRPLVKPAKVAGASIPQLLENLKLPEYRSRYRSRRELRGRTAKDVLPAVKKWAAALDKKDPNYEHNLCEALWATWAQNEVDVDLLQKCLHARDYHARAAAVSVVRFSGYRIPNRIGLLMQAVHDTHPRVRLEANIAASWLDRPAGAKIVLESLRYPHDQWTGPVTQTILEETLGDDVKALLARKKNPYQLAKNEAAQKFLDGKLDLTKGLTLEEDNRYGPSSKLTADQLKEYEVGFEVFRRDAHCSTCHQTSGRGVPSIYPPLTMKNNPWLTDSDDRLIKVILKGLWGPMELGEEQFDPTTGVPPMPGFAPLLSDQEIAAVINYVRNSFGNKASFIKAGQVARVRKSVASRTDFYLIPDLMKEHPIKGWEKWKASAPAVSFE
ncbi:MAG: PVC-type heme-binding CxxCH protein [Verrucomicrobiia bacterium]